MKSRSMLRGEMLEMVLQRTRRVFRKVETFLDQKLRSHYFVTEAPWSGLRLLERAAAEMHGQVYQIQKLATIGQMTAGIAHELNSPAGYVLTNLATMGGYAKDVTHLFRAADVVVALLGAGRDPAPAIEEFVRLKKELDADFVLGDLERAVEESREGAQHIFELVKTLRDFSRADEGEMKLVEINDVVENAIRISWNELKFKATVSRDLQTVPPVMCNPQRIGQVVLNMLVNAAQSIKKKGEVRVSTRQEQGCAVIRIGDTGGGIAPENIAKLFSPFFTTKPAGQGTGLGLHMAYQTVKDHGGKIDVITKVGKGTEFAVRLPLKGPQSTVHSPQSKVS